MTLRRRLVVAMAVIAAIVIGSTIGVLVILRESLRNELDKQLVAATRSLVDRSGEVDGSSSGTQTALTDLVVTDSTGTGASGGPRPAQSSDELLRLAPEVAEAHATDLSAPVAPFDAVADGDRRVRATAVRVADGRIVVTALSTDHIDATFRRVAAGSTIVAAALLTAMALLAWWVERLGLRPIRSVTAAADAIAAGDTARRVEPPPPGTEAAQLAHAFNVMVAERQAAEDRLRRFVADASHELRTPLTTINGVCELACSGSLTGTDLDEALQRAQSEARRMASLVEGLLQLTQLDHGRPLAGDNVDLALLVRDAALDVGLVQPARPVTVDVQEGAIVTGDEARLRQVVGNLVNNVLTHTPPSAALHLAVRADRGSWVVEVRDAGPGLTAEQAERVFDRFYRVDRGRSRRAGGTGLGLSIVQSIVTAHHGAVSVVAAPDRGSTFRVVLPASLQQPSSALSEERREGVSRSSHDTDADRDRRAATRHSSPGNS